MIKAILLDLDNTLLNNPDRAFALAFAQAFNDFASSQDISISQFHSAIQAMGQNRTGDESNDQFMFRHIAANTTKTAEEISTLLSAFYSSVYPIMEKYIQPIPGAAGIISALYQAGYAIVIATQSIYPVAAIQQRMQWAGLPQDSGIYALITGLENMHFSKPDPAYYAEILARVGIEPDEAIMVGDSLRTDIEPAQLLGIQTFHLDGNRTLDSFSDYLQTVTKQPGNLHLTPQMVMPQLIGNIGALYGLLSEVKSEFWHQRPDPNEWSIVQILCHLLTSEETNERPRLLRILSEENPFLIQPKPPGPNLPICHQDGYEIAGKFRLSRLKTLELLQSLSNSDWQRLAKHSIFGLTNLLEMAYFTAQHDRLHLNQLCQTIGRCR